MNSWSEGVFPVKTEMWKTFACEIIFLNAWNQAFVILIGWIDLFVSEINLSLTKFPSDSRTCLEKG